MLELAHESDRSARVHISGEVDMATAGELQTALQDVEQRNPDTLVLDLNGVTFIDSSGLHVLLNCARRGQRAHRQVMAVNVSRHLRRLFALVALDKTLVIADDVRA